MTMTQAKRSGIDNATPDPEEGAPAALLPQFNKPAAHPTVQGGGGGSDQPNDVVSPAIGG